MVAVEVTRSEPLDRELKPSHGCLIAVTVLSAAVVNGLTLALLALLARGVMPAQWLDPGVSEALFADPWLVFGSALLTQLLFLASVPLAVKLGQRPAGEILALRRVRPLTIVLAVGGMLSFSLVGDAVIALLRQWRPEADSVLFALEQMIRELGPGPRALVVIGVGLLPALCEEALFRGVLFTAFLKRWGAPATVASTALLFALVHFDLLQSPAAFLLGCYLGVLRLRSGSLWPAIAAHAANNLVAMLLGVSAGATVSPDRIGAWAFGGLLLGLLVLPMVRPVDEQ